MRRTAAAAAGGNAPAAALLRRVWPPVKATLATVDDAADATHLLEIKYDGYRALIGLARGEALIWSRNALDRSSDFPEIAAAVARLPAREAVLDGEIVAVRGGAIRGMQDFQEGTSRARLLAFDLLWLDGDDLRARPLEERRAALERLLAGHVGARGPLALARRVPGPPAKALAWARAEGLEGVIAKRRGTPYTGGRGRDWLKLKVVHTQDVVLIGCTPLRRAGAPPDQPVREVGALVIAVRDGSGYRYAGKVGTGMSAALRRKLWRMLAADRVDSPPAADAPRLRDARWSAPRYAAEVGFTEWTRDGRLRHPAFRGLRPDKSVEECVRERPG